MAPDLTLLGDHPSRAESAALKAVISISLPFAQCLEAKPTLAQLFTPTPARQTSAGWLPSVVIGTRHLLPISKWILKPMSRRIIKLTQSQIPPEVPSIPSITAAPQVSGEQVIPVRGGLQMWLPGTSLLAQEHQPVLDRSAGKRFSGWLCSSQLQSRSKIVHLCFDVLKLIRFIPGQTQLCFPAWTTSLSCFLLVPWAFPHGV